MHLNLRDTRAANSDISHTNPTKVSNEIRIYLFVSAKHLASELFLRKKHVSLSGGFFEKENLKINQQLTDLSLFCALGNI